MDRCAASFSKRRLKLKSALLYQLLEQQMKQYQQLANTGAIATLQIKENKERESLLQRQTEIQNQLNRDARELQQTEIELNKTVIYAPESGTILKLDLRNSSQVVRPGEAIAQIAPNHAALFIKARVAAQDISNVRLCKQAQVEVCKEGKVQLRISTYPYPDYGTLKGAVRAIAPN